MNWAAPALPQKKVPVTGSGGHPILWSVCAFIHSEEHVFGLRHVKAGTAPLCHFVSTHSARLSPTWCAALMQLPGKLHQHISAGIQESLRRPTLQILTKWGCPSAVTRSGNSHCDNEDPPRSIERLGLAPRLSHATKLLMNLPLVKFDDLKSKKPGSVAWSGF